MVSDLEAWCPFAATTVVYLTPPENHFPVSKFHGYLLKYKKDVFRISKAEEKLTTVCFYSTVLTMTSFVVKLASLTFLIELLSESTSEALISFFVLQVL